MARAVPADYREFVRVSVDLPLNPKLAMLDEPAAGWAYVVSLCYCGQSLTDGHFPIVTVLRLSGVERSIAKLLTDVGMWHEPGHDCPKCPQPKEGTAVVHDYLEHQRSEAEAKQLRAARREAGQKGAAKRWGSADDKSHSKSHSNRQAKAMANGSQVDSKPMAEVEVEVEGDNYQQRTPSSVDARKRATRATRLPEDFAATPEMIAWARDNTPHVGAHETAKFVDYWLAASGRNATKRDWVAAWRYWMRGAQDRLPTAHAAQGRPAASRPSTTDQRVADAQALKARFNTPTTPDLRALPGGTA